MNYKAIIMSIPQSKKLRHYICFDFIILHVIKYTIFFYKQLIFIVRIVRDRALNNWHMSYHLICILNKYNVACDKNQVKKTKLKQLWYMNQPTCTQVPKSNQFFYPSVHLSVWYLLVGAYFSHLPFLATTLLSGCFGVIMCMPIN